MGAADAVPYSLFATRYSPIPAPILHFWPVFGSLCLDSRRSAAISPGIRRGISRAACFCANSYGLALVSMGLALGRAKIVSITTDQKADPGKPCWEYVRGRDRTRRKTTMFAVIKTGGRQYRVVPDDVLEIGKIAGDVGTIVQLGEVLMVGGDTPVLGMPTVAGASVAAEVLDHKRGPKVIAFKKRRRKNSRRKRG